MTYGIVIASYKYGHLASHAIESVLSQSKPFDKIFFVDDGAGDCQHLLGKYPIVEFIIRENNIGIIDNFNDMLLRMDTDYVMFMGADNWIASNTLERIHESIGDSKICVYDIMVTGELKDEIHKFYPDQTRKVNGDWYWSRRGFHHGSMMYHVLTAIELGGYKHNNTSSRTDEDLNLWEKFKVHGCKSVHIDEAFLYYRRHKENFNKY